MVVVVVSVIFVRNLRRMIDIEKKTSRKVYLYYVVVVGRLSADQVEVLSVEPALLGQLTASRDSHAYSLN